MAARKFRLALVQVSVTSDRDVNNQRSIELVEQAAKEGAKIVSLPEFCNVAYNLELCAKLAEPIPGGPSTAVFSKLAADNKIYLISASFPELHDGKVYNTSAVFGPDGKLIAKHQKFHLFDVNVPGRITHQESKVMSPGAGLTMFDTEFCKVGVGICYDMRFAEMAQIYARKGCELLIYPGAFSMTTGPAHWELLVRARAVDNQCYAAAVSPARDATAPYVAWGHSTAVDPWGKIVATADETEQIVYADIDLDYLREVRSMLPTTAQRRNDFYDVVALVEPKTNV